MTGLEDFIDACRKGQTAAVRNWIAGGRRVNEPGSGKTTALMAAAEHGRLEIVKLLVDAGADVCFRGAGGWTALMLAARGGHRDIVELLLNAGADPNSETILRDTAHSLAVANGKMRVARLLENAGSTVNAKALHDVAHDYVVQKARATRDYTPRARKAAANKAENLRPRLESIIAAGAEGGDYALWEAAKYRQRDAVRLLLAAKANPNAAPHGTSALSMACEKRDLVTAQLLLDAGADPNFGGETDEPLFVAIEKNSRQLVAELIRRGANVNVQRSRGITPLLLATSKNNLALMGALLDAGADPNLPGTAEIGPAPKATVTRERIEDSILEFKTTHIPSAPEAANVTPLIVAARRDFRHAARLLLKRGADAEFKDAEGMTAMAWAKKLRHNWIQRILLGHGANASASVEGSLDNALLTAARKGNLARVQELLSQGANANAHIDSADRRRTPLGEAAQHGSSKVIEALLKAGAEVDKPTGELLGARDVTPLMIAAEAGHVDAVAVLLKAGANVGTRDSGLGGTGATPLHYAARGGNPEVLKLLIAAGAEVSKRDQFKTTPMHSAASNGHAEAIDVLLQHTTIRTTKGVSETLSLAAISGHVAAVKRILAANPKCHDNDPEFAVTMAFGGRLEIIKELVKAGMRFDQKNRDGLTPLRMAKKAGRAKVLEYLKMKAPGNASRALVLAAFLWLTTAVSEGAIVFEGEMNSAVLGKPRRIHVYVPPSYESSPKKRYPVLYIHDGQNAFSTAGQGAAFGWGPWDFDKTADRLIAAGKIEELIMVAIDCSNERYKEYRGPAEWTKAGDSPHYDRYERFLIEELKPKIDREYRTKKTAKDTGTIGSSMGGIVSLALGWQHPKTFGKIASLSGAFQVESHASLKNLRAYSGKKKPIRIYLDSGRIDYTGGDDGLKDTQAVAEELRRIGYKKDLLHVIDDPLTADQLRPLNLSEGKFKEALKSQHNELYWRLRLWRPLEFIFPAKPAK